MGEGTRWIGIVALGAIFMLACGDDADNSGGHADAGGTGGATLCDSPQATQPCGDDCAFPVKDLDCGKACENLAETCAGGSCGACTGMELAQSVCTMACSATKALTCLNLTYGCWAQTNDCRAVGQCMIDNS